MVEKLKKYRCTYISDQGNKFDADAEESNEGEFFKVVDVEAILNSHQQLKAEIRAMCIELECTSHDKFDSGMYHALRGRLRELSAV